jgi:pimeloyl-ACP methyl ester carboxylesterase
VTPRSIRVPLATGLSYHALEWGHDDPAREHTVVLLHGFLDLAWTFVPMCAAGLGERFHVVAPDLRGHGDSDRVGAGGYYHFADYLADLHSFLAKVARARVSLVGHSMGGSVAAYYAGTFPERVFRLALLEGTGPPEAELTGPVRAAAWIEGWQRARARVPRGYSDVAEAAARLQQGDPLLAHDLALELAEHGTARGADGRLRWKHDPLHQTQGPYAFAVEVALRFFSRVACPVLLVEAAESQFRHPPEEAARRHGAFADARLALLPQAGHMMQRHQPAALSRLLDEFLGG